ncbi:helix-turn-helix domain-containing protein [Microbacterium sp.]|uniref:helix-turn-helix domain-containing protein n=1 Tax=Microbacterium sp. TaxID=51671 RepID=UPI0039E3B0D0
MTRDRVVLPSAFIAPSGDVMVPPDLAFILTTMGHLDDFQRHVRGRNPRLDAALEALRVAGVRWAGSDRGSDDAEPAEVPSEWLTTAQAADQIGCSPRWVRALIDEKKLQAMWAAGAWAIRREDVRLYQAGRGRE